MPHLDRLAFRRQDGLGRTEVGSVHLSRAKTGGQTFHQLVAAVALQQCHHGDVQSDVLQDALPQLDRHQRVQPHLRQGFFQIDKVAGGPKDLGDVVGEVTAEQGRDLLRGCLLKQLPESLTPRSLFFLASRLLDAQLRPESGRRGHVRGLGPATPIDVGHDNLPNLGAGHQSAQTAQRGRGRQRPDARRREPLLQGFPLGDIADLADDTPVHRQRRPSGGPAVPGQRIQEGVRGGVVGLARVPHHRAD